MRGRSKGAGRRSEPAPATPTAAAAAAERDDTADADPAGDAQVGAAADGVDTGVAASDSLSSSSSSSAVGAYATPYKQTPATAGSTAASSASSSAASTGATAFAPPTPLLHQHMSAAEAAAGNGDAAAGRGGRAGPRPTPSRAQQQHQQQQYQQPHPLTMSAHARRRQSGALRASSFDHTISKQVDEEDAAVAHTPTNAQQQLMADTGAAVAGGVGGAGGGLRKQLDFLASAERHNQSGKRLRKQPINYRELLLTMQASAAADRAAVEAREEQTRRELDALKAQVAAQHARATRSRVHQTFMYLSSWLLIAVVALLVYYNVLMFAPHLSAMCFAALCSIILARPQRLLLQFFRWADAIVHPVQWRLYFASAAVFAAIGVAYSRSGGAAVLLVSLSLIFVFGMWTFLLFGDRRSVTALLLVTAVVLLIAFPLFFSLKTCLEESQKIGERVNRFIEENTEFHAIVDDFGASRTYQWIRAYAESWGWHIPAFDSKALRLQLIEGVSRMGHSVTIVLGGVLDVVSNVGRFIVAVLTFVSFLYYFLESGHSITSTIGVLSPFSPDDNAKLSASLSRSVFRILVCSSCVGLLHAVTTYLSFSAVGIDLCLILSIVSGFAAMLPVFSSWIVWLPASLGLFLMGQTLNAAIVAAAQLLLNLWIDPLIYSAIPGNTYVIGLAFFMGYFVFGAIGVVLGPLIIGISITVIDIYSEYKEMPHHSTKQQTAAPHAGASAVTALVSSSLGVSQSQPSLRNVLHVQTQPTPSAALGALTLGGTLSSTHSARSTPTPSHVSPFASLDGLRFGASPSSAATPASGDGSGTAAALAALLTTPSATRNVNAAAGPSTPLQLERSASETSAVAGALSTPTNSLNTNQPIA